MKNIKNRLWLMSFDVWFENRGIVNLYLNGHLLIWLKAFRNAEAIQELKELLGQISLGIPDDILYQPESYDFLILFRQQ